MNDHAGQSVSVWMATATLPPFSTLAQNAHADICILGAGVAGLTTVYCDDAGQMHECSAVCPHLGGIVAWNHSEETWDCPCHGSRFDKFGKVLNGPAITNLHPVAAPNSAESRKGKPELVETRIL